MKRDVKQAIIEATLQLINERGSNLADITIRDICQEAGVGVGLINYHFQSKENLITNCVQKMIEQTVSSFVPEKIKNQSDKEGFYCNIYKF